MALDLTTSYFSIEKADRNADGTLTVYGKATDDSLDIDQQICDAAWLERAMPEWFTSGGNIREQHSQIAAGVAKEYEAKADGHYISALVVDPNSVKKVETGVLKGFSIGIKRPRVVRDTKAVNGRIIDGQIVEVSLVDRPANPNAKLMLAKSIEGESSLVQVEEFIDADVVKHPGHGSQAVHAGNRGGSKPGGAGGGAGSGEGSAGGGAGSSGVKESHAKQIEGHEADARGLSDSVTDIARGDSMVRPAAQSMRAAAGRLQDATGAKTKEEAVSSLKKAKMHVDNAVKNLEDQNYHMEASDAYSLSKRITSTIGAIGSNKSTDADLVKHPGHGDQSVHGKPRGGSKPGAGGGAGSGEGSAGGGGGSGSAEGGSGSSEASGPKTPKKVVGQAIDSAENRMDEAYKDLYQKERVPGQPMSGRMADAVQMREDAQGHLDDARTHISRGKESEAAAAVDRAAASLKGEKAYEPAAQGMRDLASQIRKGFTRVPKKASDAELRKALQSALQLHAQNKSEDVSMEKSTVELPVKVMGDILKFDKAQYEAARDALANLISIEAQEAKEGHNEIQSIAHLLEAVSHLHAWYEGEEAEGEVVEEEEIISESVEDKAAAKKEDDADAKEEVDAEDEADDAEEKKAKADDAEDDAEDDEEKAKKEADADKDGDICPTCEKEMKMCKCKSDAATDLTPTAQTGATLEGTTIVPPSESPKSVSVDPSTEFEALVEEVVEKATTSLKAKIAELVSAKEAALEKSMSLEAELATAKSLAVAGGPKRTAGPISIEKSDLLTKAAIYKAKAQATTDPTLAKGFKALADEYAAKAVEASSN